jgi:hypothetical protein
MSNAPFTTNGILTAISLAYKNSAFIADDVLPRFPVGTPEFRYTVYNKQDRFTLQETMVGRKGRVNEVEFGGTEQSAMVADYGLEDAIPQADLDNAVNTGFDVKGNSTENITELILLDREKRVADLVQDAANHAYNTTLSGTSQWSDVDASDPIVAISDALEVPMMRPNLAVTNATVALALRRHPAVVKSFNGTLGDTGMVPLAYLRDLFEIDIQIGSARSNTANKGQAMTLEHIWGSHFTLIYKNANAAPRRGLTFGLTATHGRRVSQERPDGDMGLRGGTRVRVGESVKELVVADDVSYHFANAIA